MGPAHSPSLFCGIFVKKGRKMSGGRPCLFHFNVFGLLFCSTIFSNRDDLDEFMKISPMPGPNLNLVKCSTVWFGFFKEPLTWKKGNLKKRESQGSLVNIFFRSRLIDAMSSGCNLPVVRRRPCLIYAALTPLKLTAFFYTWKWMVGGATCQVLSFRWCICWLKAFKSLSTIFAY